jgi:hypothetical protein
MAEASDRVRALALPPRELSPAERRASWRGIAEPPPPQVQRAAWRRRWRTSFLVEPTAPAQVLEALRFPWAADVRERRLGLLSLVHPLAFTALCLALLPWLSPARIFLLLPLTTLVGTMLARWPRPRFAITRRARARRHLVRARPADVADQVVPGQWRRVRGTVLPGTTFPSVSGRPCVLAYYVGERSERVRERDPFDVNATPRGQGSGQEELHALDFRMVLASGEVIDVCVQGARFLPAPPPAEVAMRGAAALTTPVARVLHEQLVVPGDQLEVLGCFGRALDRAGSAGSRTPRVGTVLRSEGRQALLLRAL